MEALCCFNQHPKLCDVSISLILNLFELNLSIKITLTLINYYSSVLHWRFYSRLRVMVMVFNATFNNISITSLRSVLLVTETGVPRENYRPVASH